MPPRRVGGTLDVKQLTAGARLVLPVSVPDALCSVGDPHAAQGDGEVCVTGLETAATVTCRLGPERDGAPAAPRIRSRGPYDPAGRTSPPDGDPGAVHATNGVAARPWPRRGVRSAR